jgi:hypothetical protein
MQYGSKFSEVLVKSDILKILIEAYPEAYRMAFETAVRTGTALVQLGKDGKMEHYYPPFHYVMVPKEPTQETPSQESS